ncbi:hypothetical protein QPK24_11755 [Paenibacillus polygoni]|uniref:Uncharacterized protein n=1 Tax=Paenibacillus polygoni TaxID=3050112 RepID=A0ABY8X8B3_9BACL|nr:hypothetical protein [Paenibacillus polygoni]WIV21298.1 hypothetical protein QPK24_11755 [Paenibacillus polygoni]
MKKVIGLVILSGTLLLSGCSYGYEDPPPGTYTQGRDEVEQVTSDTKLDHGEMITSSENEEVRLYSVNVIKDEYQGMVVDVNGKQKEFDWNFINLVDPQIFYTDVTGDGKAETIIVLNTGKGTAMSINEIHVLDENLDEINVQDVLKVVSERISSQVTKKNDTTLSIQVQFDNKELDLEHPVDSDYILNQTELGFGAIMYHKVEDQKIKTIATGLIGMAPTYAASFEISYKYVAESNEFIADEIQFIPSEDR